MYARMVLSQVIYQFELLTEFQTESGEFIVVWTSISFYYQLDDSIDTLQSPEQR